MTPFGARVQEVRQARGLSLQSFALVQGVIHALGVIWDQADELVKLADLSDPRVVIDTSGLDAAAIGRLSAALVSEAAASLHQTGPAS